MEGSNRPRSLPWLRVLPQKLRAPVRFITYATSGTISSLVQAQALQCQLREHARSPLLPWTNSVEKRFACPTVRLALFNNRR
jgi:hypothetical protein